MAIYTMVLSQSTITEAATNTTSRFDIRAPKDLPIRGRVSLVGFTVIHLVEDSGVGAVFRPLLELRIPWLSSSGTHTIASSSNPSVTPADASSLAYDQRRQNSSGLILTAPTGVTHVPLCKETYEISAPVIPSRYTVQVVDAATGLEYKNISHIILKFEIHQSSLIA